jgi:hypothetical protein
LIYGSFQYFTRDTASVVLKALHERFLGLRKVFIGNIPDKRHFAHFYRDRTPTEDELNDHEAQIGVWYLPDEFVLLAETIGWRATLSTMPADFYAAAYRFDVTLERWER